MLRTFLLVVGAVLFVVGLGARLAGHPAATPMTVLGAVLVLAVLFERWRYRPPMRTAGGEWVKTDERFIDPESGRPMNVFFNPHTGERRYDVSSDDAAS
jgi:hypothetical protein